MNRPVSQGIRVLCFILTLLAGPLAAQAQQQPQGGAARDAAPRTIEFPDTPDHLTLSVDLHTHTVFSDGSVWPDIRVQEALFDGLDAIAITDHLEYQPHKEDIPHPDRNRSHAIAREAAAGDSLMVINGSEITRSMPPGHANAVFLDDANAVLKDDSVAAYRAAREQGAFVFWNHAWSGFDTRIPALSDLHRRLIREGLLHGIEVVNTQSYSAEALQIALDHGLTIVGTSDIHGLIDWEHDVPQGGHRPVTLVFAEERSKEALKEALMEGRTAVWFKNMLIGREEHLAPLIEASLSVEEAQYQGEASSVLEVTLKNRSDARYLLESRSDYTFDAHAAVVELEPQGQARLAVKTRERKEGTVELAFEVLNATVAPGEHPVVSLRVPVEE